MATEFDIRAYEQMEKPVIIVVTSCYVTRYNRLQRYTLRDYYCSLKTYCCWNKLMLDNTADIKLRLLEQSAVVDEKMKKYEYTLRDYYCSLKTYCCWNKLMLDNTADIKLRLLEQSAAVDEKMKKYD
nr:hypothetical protein [Tanacetum cinerariifolium]